MDWPTVYSLQLGVVMKKRELKSSYFLWYFLGGSYKRTHFTAQFWLDQQQERPPHLYPGAWVHEPGYKSWLLLMAHFPLFPQCIVKFFNFSINMLCGAAVDEDYPGIVYCAAVVEGALPHFESFYTVPFLGANKTEHSWIFFVKKLQISSEFAK